MPSTTQSLSLHNARSLIREHSFSRQTHPRGRVGVELEWFTTPSSAPIDIPTLRGILDPVAPLPRGSSITFEPGGQVELSSVPFDTCGDACEAVAADTDVVSERLRAHGIGLHGAGMDPHRPDNIVTYDQRYVAMKKYFDGEGGAGRRMMCTTAAIHVNVDCGADAAGRRRWVLAHQLGPTLIAAFANSPLTDGRPSGWLSSRMGAWLAIDPTRTAPVETRSEDPADAWATYALNANVMFIRTDGEYVPMTAPMPFARWLETGHALGHPTADDLLYHLTTLFPPVRPHGWLEIRMIDMLPDPWWRAAAGVTTALLHDDEASQTAHIASQATAGMWDEAARDGIRNPALLRSAQECVVAALGAQERIGCDAATVRATSEFYDRFVARGRCPADDQLDSRTDTTVAEAI